MSGYGQEGQARPGGGFARTQGRSGHGEARARLLPQDQRHAKDQGWRTATQAGQRAKGKKSRRTRIRATRPWLRA